MRLRDGGQHQPRLQGVWLVRAHPRRAIRAKSKNCRRHTFRRRWRRRSEVPTEIAISDRPRAELAKSDDPLIHRKNTDRAAFIGAQSLFKPKAYQNNPDATASSNLSSRLPYMFACCRFAHYLKVMVRARSVRITRSEHCNGGSPTGSVSTSRPIAETPREATKCRRPLAAAQISITANEENPGYYAATFELRPHFQLEGMDIGLRLVSRLPLQKT